MQWPPPRPRPSSEPLQLRVGEGVALVGDHDPGLERDHVVAVVPLLALYLVDIAAGGHGVQFLEAQSLGGNLEERPVLGPEVDLAVLVARARGVGLDLVDHAREHGTARCMAARLRGILAPTMSVAA